MCVCVFQMFKNRTAWTQHRSPKSIKIDVNGTAVAPHGLILGQNEATPSSNLFKCLPDPPAAQKQQKT